MINASVDLEVNSHSHSLLILNINIRCLRSKITELCYHLERLQPHILLLQETWLDSSIEDVVIPGYICISRRDRAESVNRGGIATYAIHSLKNIVLLEKSADCERCWHLLRLDTGNIFIVNWYRSPSENEASIMSLREEILNHSVDSCGCIIAGDMNIHHKKWLKFSNADTPYGSMLKSICDEFDLHQHVKAPTRQQYLLDLCLSDIDRISVKTEAQVADHKALHISVPLEVPKTINIPRYVWKFKAASWQDLKRELQVVDWQPMHRGSVDQAADWFSKFIWFMCMKHIPYERKDEIKCSHPWLNQRCREALNRKRMHEDSPTYDQMSRECANIIAAEHTKYVEKLKNKISNLKKCDKRWWSLNRELLQRKAKISSIPPLRNSEKEWITDSSIKANMFAACWQAK